VIDEVAVYNDALSSLHVAEHFVSPGWNDADKRPAAATGAADSGNPPWSQAVLNGAVNPEASTDTSVHFDYGPTLALTSQTPTQPPLPAGSEFVPVSDTVSGLTPMTDYFYRVAAQNSFGLQSGSPVKFTTAASTAYRDAVVATAGLVSYWRLDETSGTMAIDSGPGPKNTGTYVGGPTLGAPGALSGASSTAVSFNGNAQYVFLPMPARPLQDNFSIEFWFKSLAGLGSGTVQWYQGAGLVDGDVANVANDFGTSLSLAGHVLAGTGNPDLTLTSQNAPTGVPKTYIDGNYHHVVFTRDQASGLRQLFVDGKLVDSGVSSNRGALNAGTSLTAAKIQSATNYLTGSIDEAAVYSAVLSQATVLDHYNKGKTGS
jgi:hypothetical protein